MPVVGPHECIAVNVASTSGCESARRTQPPTGKRGMAVVVVVVGVVLGAVLGRVRTLPVVAQVLAGIAGLVAFVLLTRGLWSEDSSTWALDLVALCLANLITTLSTFRRTPARHG